MDERPSFFDRLGPMLSSGLVVTIGSALVIGAVAVRDLVVVASNDIEHLAADVARLRQDLDTFRAPGDRFTKHDGERLAGEIDELRNSLGTCRERIGVTERELETARRERDRLCDRVQACRPGGGQLWSPP